MMLRILLILSLTSIIGAHKHDTWKHDLKNFFETLSREMNNSLLKSLNIFSESSTASSNTESSSTKHCESGSNCHRDSETTPTTTPMFDHKPETLDDHILHKVSPASTSQQYQQQVGSMKGTPGENFPDYTDIPTTSFSCADKNYVPGFYADLESGCQVFHACWPHRRESFLCPVGTTFNQALLACDYWYSSNCSLAPHYYNVNGFSIASTETKDTPEGSMIDVLLGAEKEPSKEEMQKIVTSEPDMMAFISQFLPVKAKVAIYPETSDSKPKIVATASVGKRKKRHHSTKDSPDYTQEPQSTTETVVSEESLFKTRLPECPETIKYINVEAAVKLAFERIDEVIKNIIRDVKNYTAADAAKKDCRTTYTDNISLLTKIKRKLSPRPLVPPVMKKEEPVITPKTDDSKDHTVTKPPDADIYEKSVHPKMKHTRLSISPQTKKVLIASYIKLLKLRRS